MNLSPIEWTDYTSNPIRYRDQDGNVVHACIHASTGCIHCYAETLAPRWGRAGNPFSAENMKPLIPFIDEKEIHSILTHKPAAGKKCFIGDMTDIFGEWVSDELLDKLFAAMALRSDITFQLLTKRADRMRRYCETPSGMFFPALERIRALRPEASIQWPLRNVWLGVSAENQEWANKRIPALLSTPAAVHFVSYEPALGPIDFRPFLPRRLSLSEIPGSALNDGCSEGITAGLGWGIIGGESGFGARPFDAQWARDAVRQYGLSGVPVFVKQFGSVPVDRIDHLRYWPDSIQRNRWNALPNGCSIAGTHLSLKLKSRKGGDPLEWPEELRVRDFPREARQ